MKKQKATGKEITPSQMREVIQKYLHEKMITAAEFYRLHKEGLKIKAKQRSFEQYVTSEKMAGAGCLIPAYEFIAKKVIVKAPKKKGEKIKYIAYSKIGTTALPL